MFGIVKENDITVEAEQTIISERDIMRAFIDRWENKLDKEFAQMGAEAKALGYKVDGLYGGCHYSSNWKIMSARMELKVML